MQVFELVGISDHINCINAVALDIEGSRREFSIGLLRDEARQAANKSEANKPRFIQTKQFGEFGLKIHHRFVADNGRFSCRPFTAAVSVHAHVGGEHFPERC